MKLPIRRSAVLQQRAQNLRQNQTLAEQHLWRHLRGKQLNGIKFRRQYVIGNYIVDFVSLEHKIVIELDGGQHAEQQDYDQRRSEFLHARHYRVLRFWNNDVLQHTDAVLENILSACLERYGASQPPRCNINIVYKIT